MRLVLDTSVLISALRSPSGASAAVLEMVIDGRFTLLMNLAMACEYRDVALRLEHLSQIELPVKQVQAVIEELEGLSEAVEITVRHRPLSIDPNDDLVLEHAINGGADTTGSNNIRHLRIPGRRFGFDVLDAKTLLKDLNGVR